MYCSQNIYDLQNALVLSATLKDNLERTLNEFSVTTKSVREYNAASFKLQPLNSYNENWFVTSAAVELVRNSRSKDLVIVRYNNLEDRLPSLKSSVEYR